MSKNLEKTEGPQMTSQHGAYALHAGLARLQTLMRMHTPTRPSTHTPTHTHINNTYCFSTVTMVSWTRVSVALYVHCLSCSYFISFGSIGSRDYGLLVVVSDSRWTHCTCCPKENNIHCKTRVKHLTPSLKWRIILSHLLWILRYSFSPKRSYTSVCRTQQPNASQGRLILDVSRSHTMTHRIRLDFSTPMITQHKILTRDKYPCRRWDSNPQSQQASGCSSTDHSATGISFLPLFQTTNIIWEKTYHSFFYTFCIYFN